MKVRNDEGLRVFRVGDCDYRGGYAMDGGGPYGGCWSDDFEGEVIKMSWVNDVYLRYHVSATYNGQLEVIGWSVWDNERRVNVVSTETVCNRDVVQTVADYLNSGVLVHHVEG